MQGEICAMLRILPLGLRAGVKLDKKGDDYEKIASTFLDFGHVSGLSELCLKRSGDPAVSPKLLCGLSRIGE
jgi:hypothetical protein